MRILELCTLSTLLILAACDSKKVLPSPTEASHQSDSEGSERQVSWSSPTVVDTGPAVKGPWKMNDSRFHYVDDPTVAFAENGHRAISWVDNQAQNVLFQRFDADGAPIFDEPRNVSRSSGIFSWLPKMVVTDDEVYVLWQEIVFSGGSHGGEIFFARSTDAGASFDEPINLSKTQAGCGKGRLTPEGWHNGSLDLARTSDGTLVAAWTEYEGPLRVARSADRGESFTRPVRVGGTRERPARGPSLETGPDGAVYLAWATGGSLTEDIRLVESNDHGETFTEPMITHNTDLHSDAPKLALAHDGALHLALCESEDFFGPDSVHFASRRPDDERFGKLTHIAGSHDGTGAAAGYPQLSTGSGTVFVAWEHFPKPEDQPRAMGFTLSSDGGKSFDAPAIVPGTDGPGFNGSQQGRLMQKIDMHDGRVVVSTSKIQPARKSQIFVITGMLPPDAKNTVLK